MNLNQKTKANNFFFVSLTFFFFKYVISIKELKGRTKSYSKQHGIPSQNVF